MICQRGYPLACPKIQQAWDDNFMLMIQLHLKIEKNIIEISFYNYED